MSRIAQLKETSDFLGINIPFNEEDKRHTFNQICTDLVVKTHEEYKDSIFYVKNDMVYMELHKNKNLYCSYNLIWSIFEKEYGMQYNDIQSFIKGMVEEGLKMKGITPSKGFITNGGWKRVSK